MFEPADLDLHDFFLQEDRSQWFKEDRAIFKAIHGLSSGLRYLHHFELAPSTPNETSPLAIDRKSVV